ncbi:hypothetical protein AN958_06034 [Leucoagaricus sp. SymC.cos]|nr:hypothetical protein AN958_06034 [Leucoagaricus sp. SymC.cos]
MTHIFKNRVVRDQDSELGGHRRNLASIKNEAVPGDDVGDLCKRNDIAADETTGGRRGEVYCTGPK